MAGDIEVEQSQPAFPHLPRLRWVPFLSRVAGEDEKLSYQLGRGG